MRRARTVEEYITGSPKELQGKLTEIRTTIKEAAPDANESIAYGIPYYECRGRLAWFSLAKAHIGLYLRPPVIQRYRRELRRYTTTKSAVHIPLDGEVPVPLVKRLVKTRLRMNLVESARSQAEI